MAKKKQNKSVGLLVLVLGIFFLMTNFNILGNPFEGARESQPDYDGFQSDFSLRIKDTADEAVVDGLYWVELEVKNNQQNHGQMFVQCSILDRDEHDWLNQLQAAQFLITSDNCVANEPFTQTARVGISEGDTEDITFTMRVPDNTDGDNVIFCGTFEQCYAEGVDTMESDSLTREITIEEKGEGIFSGIFDSDDKPETDQCVNTQDCSQLFWAPQVCNDGLCVDKEDDPTEPLDIDVSDSAITGWVKENSIISWAIGLILLIVGFVWAFQEPKQPQFRF